MVPNLPDSPALQRLEAAFARGDVYLVGEDAQPLKFIEALDQHCWAHMRSPHHAGFVVQELRGSRSLLLASYQDVLMGIV